MLFFIVAALIHIPMNSARWVLSPHSHQHSLFPDFSRIAVLTVMRQYLLVVLHFSNSAIEHLFLCLLAICMSSEETFLRRSLSIFKNCVFFFVCVWLLLSCLSIISFVQKLLSLIRSHLYIFAFISFPLDGFK